MRALLALLLVLGLSGCAPAAIGPADVVVVRYARGSIAGPGLATTMTVERERIVIEDVPAGRPGDPAPTRTERGLTPAEREAFEADATRAFGLLPEQPTAACTDTGTVSITIITAGRRQERSASDCGGAGEPVISLLKKYG